MSSERIIGTETEYGVYRPGDAWANPIALSTKVVTTYGEISRTGTPAQGAGVVRWDYTGEDPLNDLRGMSCRVRPLIPRFSLTIRTTSHHREALSALLVPLLRSWRFRLPLPPS